jgi:hypothetical protein
MPQNGGCQQGVRTLSVGQILNKQICSKLAHLFETQFCYTLSFLNTAAVADWVRL